MGTAEIYGSGGNALFSQNWPFVRELGMKFNTEFGTIWSVLAVAGAVTVLIISGCSAESDSGSNAGPFSGSGRGGSAEDAAGSSGAAAFGGMMPYAGTGDYGRSGSSAPGGAGGQEGEETCATESHEGVRTPLDIYVMMDISGSMAEEVGGSDTRWTIVRDSLLAFLQEPTSAGMGFGLQYFPSIDPNAPVTCMTDADCVSAAGTDYGPCLVLVGVPELCPLLPFLCVCTNSSNCDVGIYAVPAVPIVELPAGFTQLSASLNAQNPAGSTPTRPALEGAIQYATQWQIDHPDRKTVVILATDGEPQGCNLNTVQDVANIAAAGLGGTPSITTFVIGVGSSLNNLNTIAAAGGTDQAYLVEPGDRDQFKAALDSIRMSSLSCDYFLPDPATLEEELDFEKVNIRFTPAGQTTPVLIMRTADGTENQCDPVNGGWYYDNPSAPTMIRMCPVTCEQFNLIGGKVEIEIGCATEIAPPIE
jgi:Mg-chelatase subunit ChlD